MNIPTDIDPIELAWLAGILEGEGSFDYSSTPRIRIKMGDKDVIEKAAKLFKGKVYKREDRRLKHSDMFETAAYGVAALMWMKRVFPLMGTRRKAKILEILDLYAQRSNNTVSRKKPKAVGTN